MPKKILVVDDEEDIVTILLCRLKKYGYATASAVNGREALEVVKKDKFDLILLDIMMPVMDGLECARQLKNDAATKNIPLIFLTALQAKQEYANQPIVGSGIIFTKPFDIKELAAKIEEVLKDRP